MTTHVPAPRRRQSGFALLITITLLAFLVMLLVSLAALTRVETQVASNSQQLSQARQNALMGLNIALGRLQAAAGPDTRITATADILPSRHVDKKNWTGVWNAAVAGADKNIAWLVSGNPAAGAATVGTALPAAGVVSMVGANTTDTSIAGNEVKVPTEVITSNTVAGVSGPQTIGNFAYWVGDEGVKANVSLADPWDTPSAATLGATTPATTASQAVNYRFINAQRMGIEGVDASATGSPLASAYPASDESFRNTLPKILSLAQLPLAHADSSGQTVLTLAKRNRFHDLTASSFSVLADAANGGLKKDLTAWAANPAPSSPGLNDYVVPGDAADVTKYGLPKWGLLHSYLNTRESATPLVPRLQTPEQHGIFPVITYARIGYNLTCPPGGGIYRINVMPCVALWNPYNVPLQASTFEFCFKYTPNFNRVNWPGYGNFLQLLSYTGGYQAQDYFNLSKITVGNVPHGTGSDPQFWRFKLQMSTDLAPGESRVFTVSDTHDESQFSIGQSTLSDAVYGTNNAVYLPSTTPLTAARRNGVLFWNTEPGDVATTRAEFLLSEPVPAVVTTPAAIESHLRSRAYQTLVGTAFSWGAETNPPIVIPESNNGRAVVYHRIELMMSTLSTSEGQGSSPGTPRWLAILNPTASVALRKPSATINITPSYLKQEYIKYEPTFTYRDLPAANGTNVSAGTKVATLGAPQNFILRQFHPADTAVFSLGQLQHASVATLNVNPAFAIGNSAANLYVQRTGTDSGALGNDAHPGLPSGTFNRIYDLSYLLNRALWDRYFFSTVPSNPAALTVAHARNSAYHLPNSRHTFYWDNAEPDDTQLDRLRTSDSAAAHLLLKGGFNINSTSVQAWKALLYSHNGIATDPAAPGRIKHPYSRFAAPHSSAAPNATWLGYRILSDEQIDALATAIVAEIRARGPFLSLSEFINRKLVADATGLKGPLQAAIDTIAGTHSINDVAPFTDNTLKAAEFPPDVTGNSEQETIFRGGTTTTLSAASRAAHAPGYLTQADLLTVIGASLTARSDTFRIRAYGETRNPVTSDVQGRAWCEAVVQRLPEYTEVLASEATPAAGSNNERFGRRFRIINFRWLSSDEI